MKIIQRINNELVERPNVDDIDIPEENIFVWLNEDLMKAGINLNPNYLSTLNEDEECNHILTSICKVIPVIDELELISPVRDEPVTILIRTDKCDYIGEVDAEGDVALWQFWDSGTNLAFSGSEERFNEELEDAELDSSSFSDTPILLTV